MQKVGIIIEENEKNKFSATQIEKNNKNSKKQQKFQKTTKIPFEEGYPCLD